MNGLWKRGCHADGVYCTQSKDSCDNRDGWGCFCRRKTIGFGLVGGIESCHRISSEWWEGATKILAWLTYQEKEISHWRSCSLVRQ